MTSLKLVNPVRPILSADKGDWLRMRQTLWPGSDAKHEAEVEQFFRGGLTNPEAVFLAERNRQVCGFAELSIRNYAEGCITSRVGYLEGLFVDPDARRQGIGWALVEAGEAWARDRGCAEFASDAELENSISARVHARLSFTEVSQIRCFRKSLKSGP